jgi:hypothetical protein
MPDRPPPVTDSPWFWLMLFGSVALVMLAAVEPKFARRQERLERMQQSRQSGRSAERAAGGDSEPSQTPFWQPSHRTSLRPLMLFLAALLAVGIIVLNVRRKRAMAEGPMEPQDQKDTRR